MTHIPRRFATFRRSRPPREMPEPAAPNVEHRRHDPTCFERVLPVIEEDPEDDPLFNPRDQDD